MENPHETVQNAILVRIASNIDKLNESLTELNRMIETINRQNLDIELTSRIWLSYMRNIQFHLESTNNLRDPV
ncbi:hypothetical protein CANCADRAFT_52620 [Tortispora caseinolytica NRRL Y-17796]|uniref:DASH complex subunit DAD4 n=1 Tax=Tortispora caseinolytica NRRL Y-17796 TaxID=767744 RepID=A0A1E4TA15_9ASCO|nr:hypothetical protein CANCADRAFT_52620 [Tortispora caseinolytica NRRL Y-17796]